MIAPSQNYPSPFNQYGPSTPPLIASTSPSRAQLYPPQPQIIFWGHHPMSPTYFYPPPSPFGHPFSPDSRHPALLTATENAPPEQDDVSQQQKSDSYQSHEIFNKIQNNKNFQVDCNNNNVNLQAPSAYIESNPNLISPQLMPKNFSTMHHPLSPLNINTQFQPPFFSHHLNWNQYC